MREWVYHVYNTGHTFLFMVDAAGPTTAGGFGGLGGVLAEGLGGSLGDVFGGGFGEGFGGGLGDCFCGNDGNSFFFFVANVVVAAGAVTLLDIASAPVAVVVVAVGCICVGPPPSLRTSSLFPSQESECLSSFSSATRLPHTVHRIFVGSSPLSILAVCFSRFFSTFLRVAADAVYTQGG